MFFFYIVFLSHRLLFYFILTSFYFQVIQEAIDMFQKKNETFKLASKETKEEDPVRWIISGGGCFEKVEHFTPILSVWFTDGGTWPTRPSLDQGQRSDLVYEMPGTFQRTHQEKTSLQSLWMCEWIAGVIYTGYMNTPQGTCIHWSVKPWNGFLFCFFKVLVIIYSEQMLNLG